MTITIAPATCPDAERIAQETALRNASDARLGEILAGLHRAFNVTETEKETSRG